MTTSPSEPTHESAVREWVASQVRMSDSSWDPPRRAQLDEIRNVRFGIEEDWGSTDGTPGGGDYAAVTFELLKNGKWVPAAIGLHKTPAAIVAECLEIWEQRVTASPTTEEIDRTLKRVNSAHWGGSLSPPSPTVTTQVFNRFLRDARTLASEVARLRKLAGELAARQASTF